jgi:tetratricopeptide (TPR) repeat protein
VWRKTCAAVVADASYILDKYELEAYQRWYRGQAFQRRNRHEEATADFTLVLKYYPSDSVILERRAASYRHLGKTAQADADLEAFRKLARNRPRELNHAAWQLVKRPRHITGRSPSLGAGPTSRATGPTFHVSQHVGCCPGLENSGPSSHKLRSTARKSGHTLRQKIKFFLDAHGNALIDCRS